MGRRKSVKAENPEELRRKESQYDTNPGRRDNKGGSSRSRHGSNDSDGGGGRTDQRISRAPSTKNLYRNSSKSGSSFRRPSRPVESPPKSYKGFHFPGGDSATQQPTQPVQPQLEPLPGPRGAMPPNGSATSSYAPGYNGAPHAMMNGYAPPRNGSYESSPPPHIANGGAAAGVPLTRRASQLRMSPDMSPSSHSQGQQPNMRYPVPANGPNGTNVNMNASGYQPPLPSPAHQPPPQMQPTPPRPSIDFNQMMHSFRNLPQLPYVMSQHGPVPPPPFPFPYPDPAEVYQLQQQQQQQQMQMQMSQSGSTTGNAPPGSATPPQQYQQQYQQQHQQHQPYPAQSPMQSSYTTTPPLLPQQQQQGMSPQRPLYSPQSNSTAGNVNMNGSTNGMGPLPAPVSPFNGSGGSNPPSAVSPANTATAAAAAPLHRTTSILNRVSSFKKQPAAPVVATPEATSAEAAATATSPSAPAGGGSILNRVSSFKKNVPSASPSPVPSAVQAAQPSPSSVPPQHSAAAAKAAAAESPSTGILRRKSFFAAAAAAVPEPELSPEEREVVLKEKLAAREKERQRLEAEHQAREEAAEKLREQRLREMRAAQEAEETPAVLPAPTVVSGAKTTPTSKTNSPNSARAADNASTSPHQSVSRASSYSFASMATTRSGRSNGPQPPLPQLQKQPQSPPKPGPRVASPTPDISDYYYRGETSGSSTTLNRKASTGRTPAPLKTVPPTSAVVAEEPPQEAVVPPSQPQTVSRASASAPAPAAEPKSSPTASTVPSLAATVAPPKQLWHRCPALVLYEIPLRCRRTTNEKGEEVIDDANFPVRIAHKSLRVTDAETQLVSEYPHDEFVTHRKGSTNVESKLLDKVRDVVVAGYAASVLSVDAKGLAKPTSAFDSAAWLAKQRLVMNVISNVEKMQTIYAKNGGIASSNSSIEVSVSIALVKKVSAENAAEWKVTNPATRQRTFEVVDLLQPEPTVVPFRMNTSVLCGSRISGVEYKAVATEADFTAAMAGAQSNANIVLGRLADAAAVDPENEELAREKASVFEVLTCVVRHRKEGAVALADQLKEAPRDVFARGSADDVVSSDDEDDDARLFDGFNSHNGPSNCSDLVVSCLTCIGVRHNAELWAAALERKEEMAPATLFNTAFGGPAYTVILASIDPTKPESAEALSTQAGMTIKLHRRPTNGSARRLIQSSKFQAGAAQKELDRPVRPSGAEQRELKTSIRKSAATLDSLEKALAAGG